MKPFKLKKFRDKATAVFMVLILLMTTAITLPPKMVLAAGSTYYVDSVAGNDSNNGLGEDSPWKTLMNVNNTTFHAGDTILFKAGGSWTGKLSPKGSGESGNPITINMYGNGNKPKFDGNAQVDSTVEFINQQYWEIYNLEITNTATSDPNSHPNLLGDYRGIHVAGQDAGTLNHFVLKNLYIHDVTGWVKWIGGSTSGDGNGIYHAAGWDESKRTGAILFEVLQPGSTPVKTNFNDITVDSCVLINNSWGGIIFKQWQGTLYWASRDGGSGDPDWFPHTHITVTNNYLNHSGTNYGCDTIYLTSIQGALVQGNTSLGAGTSGIEMYYTDNVLVQHNEIGDTVVKAGGTDSNAIDPDKEATNAIIQYNYIHNTGDGILLCGFSYGSAVVRYNVIKDASKRYINPHADKGTYLIYNNVFYNTKTASAISLVSSSGGSGYLNDSNCFYKFYNNIFYNAANVSGQTLTIGTGTGMTYDYNNYYGPNMAAPAVDIHAVIGDPKFAGPIPTSSDKGSTSGPYLNLDGFKLSSGSSAIGSGLDITGSVDSITNGNGGSDYGGNALYHNSPDMGIFEYYGDTAATAEAITGIVKDTGGNLVPGATVTVTPGSYTTTADALGYYSITDIPVGSGYTVTATKNGYSAGSVESVAVVAGDTTSGVNLVVASTSPIGTIAGVVKDATNGSGATLSGVSVTVSAAGVTYPAVTTDASGVFSISNLPAGTGYSITAAKTGYQPWTVSGINTSPGMVTTLSDIYISSGKPTYLINDSFDSYTVGAAPDNWSTTKKVSGDSVAIAAFPSTTDMSVLLTQPAKGSSGQRTSLYKTLNDIKGILTIEYSINKSNTDNYWCLPYVYGTSVDNSHLSVCMAMDNSGNIIYKDGGSSGTTHTIMSYSPNTWYKFKIILNTISKKFDVYINDVKKVDQGSFRYATSATDYLKELEFYGDYNVTGSVYLNDFRLSTGIAYPVNDADLDSLLVSIGSLTKVDATHYYTTVPNFVDHISITPTADSIFAAGITVNGTAATSGQASSSVALAEGDNEIPVVVTAEDGTTTQPYTVTVNRIPTDIDANLRDLSIVSGTLSPAFAWDNEAYTASVPYSVSNIAIMPTASVAEASIMVNGTEVANGQASQSIVLKEGTNTIKVDVCSPDGTNYNTYNLTVTRGPDPNGNITGKVRDNNNNWIFGANVRLTVNGCVYSATTDTSGSYTITEVPAGSGYTVTADKTGHQNGTATDISVTAGNTTVAGDITLILITTTGTVTGTVSDHLNHPVSGALAKVTVGGYVYSGITAADGTFSIGNVPAGAGYQLVVSKPGFNDGTATVDITAGGTTTQDITLTQSVIPPTTGMLGGIVRDASNKPISGATVSITVSGYTYSDTTGDDGTFHIAGVPAGTGYTLVVGKAGYELGTATVDVTAGGMTTQNITLTQIVIPPTTGAIEGRVTNSGNNPVSGAEVSLTVSGYTYSDTTGDDGTFHIVNIPAGTGYTLAASKSGYHSSTVTLNVYAGETTPINIQLSKKSNGSHSGGNAGNDTDSDNSGSTGSSSGITTPSDTAKPGSVQVITTSDTNGKVEAAVDSKALKTAVDSAEDGIVTVTVKPSDGTKSVDVNIPAEGIKAAKDKGIDTLVIENGLATVSINLEAIGAIKEAAALQLSVAKVDGASLPEEVQQKLGSNTVYDFSLSVDGSKVSSFNSGEIKVAVDYTLKPGENPDKVVVYYIGDDGKLEVITNGRYKPETGKVEFRPKHFSRYAAAYAEVTFSDLAEAAWVKKGVEALAARQVILGEGNGQFNPNGEVTRAEFITMLMKAFELVDTTAAADLSDVNPEDWYYCAIASAQKLGITVGEADGSFGVNDRITRQDMAVMIYRAARKLTVNLAKGNGTGSFADSSDIAGYALDAVTAMKDAGLINGTGDSRFEPEALLTRAEAATIIFNLFDVVNK